MQNVTVAPTVSVPKFTVATADAASALSELVQPAGMASRRAFAIGRGLGLEAETPQNASVSSAHNEEGAVEQAMLARIGTAKRDEPSTNLNQRKLLFKRVQVYYERILRKPLEKNSEARRRLRNSPRGQAASLLVVVRGRPAGGAGPAGCRCQ